MTTVAKSDILRGLRGLGVKEGYQVLVHSSLSSLGHVIGGADAVIDALLEAVGPAGTVLVPTLTGSETLSPDNPPEFDPQRTPCWTGRIPETFRQRPEAVRSLHPTHSAAAIGAEAIALTREHAWSVTPCDELSPYGKLARRPDGYILLLGVTHESNTTFHHAEEAVGVDYHMQPGLAQARIIVGGRAQVRHVMLHRYGTPRYFGVMEPILAERGIQTQAQIGNAQVKLVNAMDMVRVTVCCLRANKRILCQDSSQEGETI